MDTMKIVPHRGLSDCCVCAVAMACRMTWEHACYLMHGHRNRRVFGSRTTDMIRAVNAAPGFFHTNMTRLKSLRANNRRWGNIPLKPGEIALVKTVPSGCEGTSNWHTVVWDGEQVWDSVYDRPYSAYAYWDKPHAYLILEPRT